MFCSVAIGSVVHEDRSMSEAEQEVYVEQAIAETGRERQKTAARR
jgi:hypothetical protein